MPSPRVTIAARVKRGEDLTMEEMADTIGHIMNGGCEEKDIADLLIGLHEKGETVAEVAGAAAAMAVRGRRNKVMKAAQAAVTTEEEAK